ncbi:MAG: ferredoxin reductase family protein [Euzebyaceae bacterium]|jgi:predicted ferric reductase|nr:ferredoxin reductase family protein [Euzebyaceae bacterium]
MTTQQTGGAAPVPADRPLFIRQGLRGPAWFLILLPLYAPVLLWLLAGPARAAFGTPAGALQALALLAGLCGYVAFAMTLILGARLPPLERLFGALDRMYRFHRRLGEAVGALLVAHVALIAGSRALDSPAGALDLFRPDGWRVFAGVVAFAAFAAVLALTLFGRLRHEPFLRVHRLFGLTYCIGALHVLRVPGLSAQTPGLTAYLGLVTAAGIGAWVYRSVFGRTLVRRHYYTVTAVRPVHPTVAEVVLTPIGERLDFSPGQLVFIGLDDDAVTRELHPFSITSAPGEEDLRLAVKAVGDFTIGLREVRPGAWAMVEGPYGGFWHDSARHRRQIWIAGGIGITPFLSIARSLDPTDYAIDLYYSTVDADAAVFIDELAAIADRHPSFRVIPVREDTLGFLTAEDVRGASGDLGHAHIFMCGPPAMMDALSTQFTRLGVPAGHLHFEDFRLRGR